MSPMNPEQQNAEAENSAVKRARKVAAGFFIGASTVNAGFNTAADQLIPLLNPEHRDGIIALNRIATVGLEVEALAGAVLLRMPEPIALDGKEPNEETSVPFSFHKGNHQYVSDEQMQRRSEDQPFTMTGRKMNFVS